MIGNDIVDLTFAKKESNWKRPRFLDKVFTISEQKLITNSSQQSIMVWLLWSMKESAYKLHVQLFGKRFFAPKRFECSITELTENQALGSVYCLDFQCYTKTRISDKFVYTTARLKKDAVILSHYFSIENPTIIAQHESVNQKSKAHFAKHLGTPSNEIRIQKNSLGIPFLYSKKQTRKVAVSKTHHGNYGAFAYNKLI